MSIQKLNPYLNFNGNAAAAIAFYEKALGAKVAQLMRFSDLPDMPVESQHENRVLHAELALGGGAIMLSDGRPDHPVSAGSNSHVYLHLSEVKEMQAKFEALSAGGQVSLPIQDAFWGAKFGMLTDVFGVQWMFICELKKT
jgi:PhnB protein